MKNVLIVIATVFLLVGCSARIFTFDDSSNNEPLIVLDRDVDNAIIENN